MHTILFLILLLPSINRADLIDCERGVQPEGVVCP